MIPYGHQHIDDDDVEAVVQVLRSDFLTQGPMVPAFERTISEYCGAAHAVAANSATSALHLACLALEVGKGDIVWTSAITFVASANCAMFCGASIDFVDIDERTYNMSVVHLEQKLAQAEKSGKLPKVVIPVHLCGQTCDMVEIRRLSKRYGFGVIEDASHAIGGKLQNHPVGSCRHSDITVFSFHPVKIITTGEGGMALTNKPELARRMQLLRSHGITRERDEMPVAPDGPWSYQQIELGFNYRMTDIQAALGISQMRRLDEFVARRHVLAKRYDELLMDLPVTVPWQDPENYSSLHLYVIRLNLEQIKKTHRQVFEDMRAAGVGVNLHYLPVYQHPYYADLGFEIGLCPEAERYYAETITLPMYPSLNEAEQDTVVSTLRGILGE